MRIGSFRIDADWGHLAGVTAAAAFIVWYMLDTINASSAIENTGLIVPAGLGALGLYLFIIWGDLKVTRATFLGEDVPRAASPKMSEGGRRIAAFMALLAGLLLGMTFVGFDVSAVAFIAVGLYVLNERRWYLIIGYSIIFGLGATYFFKSMLSLPILTMVL